jgi:hypothetical protein
MYKKASLLIAVGILSVLFWIWIEPWVASPTRFADYGLWLKPLLALGALSSLIGFSLMFLKSFGVRVLVSVLAGLPFLFVFESNQYFLGAFALMIILHLYAVRNIHEQTTQRIKINIREIMNHGLPMVITPLLVLVSFAFYFSPAVQTSAQTKQLPPTVKQVVENTVSSFLGQEIQSLPPQERKQAESQLVSEVINQLTKFAEPYFKFFPPILAFGLFLILQGLSFVFVWLGVAISVLLFWVLKKAGAVRLKMVQKEVEELEF